MAVGDDADQNLLEEIARIGNGRFYFADDPGNVPQIFAKETVAASKSADQRAAVRPPGRPADPGARGDRL